MTKVRATVRLKKRKRPRASKPAPLTIASKPAQNAANDAYTSVVQRANLGTIRLLRTEFEVKPEYFATEGQPALAHELVFGGDLTTGNFDESRGEAVGIFAWWVEARRGGEARVRFTCAYLVSYLNLQGQERAAAMVFVRKVGQFATYPYFRALFSRMSTEADIDMPILPVLREGTLRSSATVPPHAPSVPSSVEAKA